MEKRIAQTVAASFLLISVAVSAVVAMDILSGKMTPSLLQLFIPCALMVAVNFSLVNYALLLTKEAARAPSGEFILKEDFGVDRAPGFFPVGGC
ncbi:hypothetical protein GZ176_11715 [Dermatophilus congolensis]|uniref:hypothetical protein n=1 Tax=Dermatophilus congolensis TaxID=1863 RepID=UPI001AAF588F|nr:hypothetical protein [Dermatophilus congolensis]MBO3146350.1 hypothetical protein [Dermatophilus congolensis]MBO3148607.1 hypothetical protein [Dermatophilus congolensis]MBO3157587.1 hypothetical protein [Dermatophilus congolensis]MBO3159867.1 hypothetical protein [Dermatophilus congolensis]MBO3166606.1 hypothetical protein [Dermatophilus congolensis]